jgi:nucleoside-diphosphate-sugar epimerase
MHSYLTGSSGFIGSNLQKYLKGEVTTIPHDKIQSTTLKPFDYFYFVSSYGNLHHLQTDDEQIFKANVADLLHVILQAKKFKFKSFVFISSSSVKLRTQITYSRAKKAAEEILLAIMEKHDIPICIIRPFTVTGVGDHGVHLIPTLIDAAFTGKQIPFVPNPTHDFIDVEDVASGILSLSQSSARGIFELGTGEKHSNLEVLQIVEKVTGKQIKVNFIDSMRSYDNQEWVSTNFKARGYGWLPKKSLEQSIKEMVKAYEETTK